MKVLSRENCRKAKVFGKYPNNKEVINPVVWVHSFFTDVDSESSALVELPDGSLSRVYTWSLQFTDLE